MKGKVIKNVIVSTNVSKRLFMIRTRKNFVKANVVLQFIPKDPRLRKCFSKKDRENLHAS